MKCHRLVTPDVSGVHLLQCGDPLAKADGKNPTDGQGTAGYVFGDENTDRQRAQRNADVESHHSPRADPGGSRRKRHCLSFL